MNKLPFLGVAYYPEAWDRSQIDEDLDKMLEHGITCVRIAEFAWKTMEPSENTFDFSLFREVVDKCKERGMSVIMGTPTACPPAWLAMKHPDIFRHNMDGTTAHHGDRRNACFNNPTIQHYNDRIVEKMAIEFASDENIIGWQIDNEIATDINEKVYCVCPHCVQQYRDWLRAKYNDDIKAFNRAVGAGVFSTAFDDFNDINHPYKQWSHPGMLNLWMEFQSFSGTEHVRRQCEIIRRYSKAPIGTDMMPTLTALSHADMQELTDVMQFNQYNKDEWFWENNFWYSLMYNSKRKPFWLTETSCCWNGSAQSEHMRPKGFVGANGWMAIMNGAESVNYWLWRTHYAAHELMHGSVIESNGRARHIKKEVQALSKQMDDNADIINGTAPVYSGINVMASGYTAHTFMCQALYPGFDYKGKMIKEVFKPLFYAGLAPSVIPDNGDFESGKILMTPFMLNLTRNGLGDKILKWVENGGIWVTGPLTDIRTESYAKYVKAATHYIEEAADVTIDFTIPAYRDYGIGYRGGAYDTNGVNYKSYDLKFTCGREGKAAQLSFDALRLGDKAKAVAYYVDEDYLGEYAAITETPYGNGKIIVLGCLPDPETLANYMTYLASTVGFAPIAEYTKNLSVVRRTGAAGECVIAVEHAFETGSLTAPFDCVDRLTGKEFASGEKIAVNPYEVVVLKRK